MSVNGKDIAIDEIIAAIRLSTDRLEESVAQLINTTIVLQNIEEGGQFNGESERAMESFKRAASNVSSVNCDIFEIFDRLADVLMIKSR